MISINIALPDSISATAQRLAKLDGITLDQYVASALAEKSAVLMSQDYLKQRGAKANRAAYDAILDRVQ
jgi:phage I-like protein